MTNVVAVRFGKVLYVGEFDGADHAADLVRVSAIAPSGKVRDVTGRWFLLHSALREGWRRKLLPDGYLYKHRPVSIRARPQGDDGLSVSWEAGYFYA